MAVASSPDLGPWAPLSIPQVQDLMESAPFPWWVAGGWAIDLFRGTQSREHADVDIGVLRQDQEALRQHLPGWEVLVASAGQLRPWRSGECLRDPDNDLWVREDPTGPWRLQVMLNPGNRDTWAFGRDPRVTVPMGEAVYRASDGTPYLAPHLQLLFKSREPRPQDDADFAAALPHLPVGRRRWLADRLREMVPDHPWLEPLG